MKPKETTIHVSGIQPKGDGQSRIILDMLESLADAVEAKADQIDGESDGNEVRSRTLRDISDAIKDRFLT